MAVVMETGEFRETIEKALKAIKDLPVTVQRWDIETGSDWSGDRGVWIWAILNDADLTAKTCAEIRTRVRRALSKVAEESIVYLRFRALSEV